MMCGQGGGGEGRERLPSPDLSTGGGGAKESDGGQDDKDGAAYLSLHKVIVECSALQQL